MLKEKERLEKDLEDLNQDFLRAQEQVRNWQVIVHKSAGAMEYIQTRIKLLKEDTEEKETKDKKPEKQK